MRAPGPVAWVALSALLLVVAVSQRADLFIPAAGTRFVAVVPSIAAGGCAPCAAHSAPQAHPDPPVPLDHTLPRATLEPWLEPFLAERARLATAYGPAVFEAVRANDLARRALRRVLRDRYAAAEPAPPVEVAVVGGSATAGACVTPGQRWPDLLHWRIRDLLQRGRAVHVTNAAQGATDTRRATTFMHALFAPGADLVAWEYAINDKAFGPTTHGGADALRLAHDSFVHRTMSLHAGATVVWVFLWDDAPAGARVANRSVEYASEPVRRSFDPLVPQVEVSLARALEAWGVNAFDYACDGAHPNARGHVVIADLVMLALTDAVITGGGPDGAASLQQLPNPFGSVSFPYILRTMDPAWLSLALQGQVRARGFPFKLPVHAASAYVDGEEFECSHRAFEWDAAPQRGWVPLRFDTLSGFKCTEFDFFWTGYAYNNRDDRQAALVVPDCARGNLTLRFPYPVRSIPSLPCGDPRCMCTVRRAATGAPVYERDPTDIAPSTPVSACCAYAPGAGPRDRVYMRDLLVLENKRAL